MKPFDLEEAKAGKPFFARGNPEICCKFIGSVSDGTIAYESGVVVGGRSVIYSSRPEQLWMVPTKVSKAVNVYRSGDGKLYLGVCQHPTYSIARGRALDSRKAHAYVGTASIEWTE